MTLPPWIPKIAGLIVGVGLLVFMVGVIVALNVWIWGKVF